MKKVLYILTTTLFLTACQAQETNSTMGNADNTSFPVQKTEQEWKAQLSSEEYYVIRQKGTERPYTGEYNMHFDEGTYTCRGCDAPLFTSDSKFDSHCGWPSFDQGIAKGAILEKLDKTHGMIRTEIVCASCGGHLGHVFNDGPTLYRPPLLCQQPKHRLQRREGRVVGQSSYLTSHELQTPTFRHHPLHCNGLRSFRGLRRPRMLLRPCAG